MRPKNLKRMSNQRKILLDQIVDRIYSIQKDGPLLVAVDGVDAAGKSYFAQALRDLLMMRERPVILASVDDFHNPAAVRYVKGKDSPEGFYFDSYNYPLLQEYLLNPFKKGQGFYKTVAYDCDNDCPVQCDVKEVSANDILVMEGIFLQRPSLEAYWDLKLFLEVSFETTQTRNIKRARDIARIGTVDQIKDRYFKRYMPGQQLYFKEASPQRNADILIDNNDYNAPFVI